MLLERLDEIIKCSLNGNCYKNWSISLRLSLIQNFLGAHHGDTVEPRSLLWDTCIKGVLLLVPVGRKTLNLSLYISPLLKGQFN